MEFAILVEDIAAVRMEDRRLTLRGVRGVVLSSEA